MSRIKKISIIIPLYHGTRYIDKLLQMASENFQHLNGQYELEIIIVNDCPDEKIQLINKYLFPIRIINHVENKGIHQSRVDGLLASEGDFIAFWDQDDSWKATFMSDQMGKIGDADVILCDAIYGNELHCFAKENIINKIENENWYIGSMRGEIVSPGQTIIKRNSIPEAWMKYIMHCNLCDDAFLWILMIDQRKKFKVNRECLYKHTENGNNTSNNWEGNIEAYKEMAGLIEENHLLSKENTELFRSGIEKRLRSMADCITADRILNSLTEDLDQFKKYLAIHSYQKVSIYGFGQMGKKLVEILNDRIRITHIYDQEAKSDKYNIEKFNKNDDSDLVIVSIVNNRNNIINWIKPMTHADVISIFNLNKINTGD